MPPLNYSHLIVKTYQLKVGDAYKTRAELCFVNTYKSTVCINKPCFAIAKTREQSR